MMLLAKYVPLLLFAFSVRELACEKNQPVPLSPENRQRLRLALKQILEGESQHQISYLPPAKPPSVLYGQPPVEQEKRTYLPLLNPSSIVYDQPSSVQEKRTYLPPLNPPTNVYGQPSSAQEQITYLPPLKTSSSLYGQPTPVQEQRTYLPSPKYPSNIYDQLNATPDEETYKKEYFVFSAPEEDFEDTNAAQKISSAIPKNVRVVFIKSPEQKGLEQATLQLVKQIYDDKTAIYVLNKQTDVGELAQRLSANIQQLSQKPEVHFVKYRTPEDAAHAQKQIQAQYDLLRGSSHTSDEGAARVLDFASQQQQPSYGSEISYVPDHASVNTAGSYLPPALPPAPYKAQQFASLGSLFNNGGGYSFGESQNAGSQVEGNSLDEFKKLAYNANPITTISSGAYGPNGGIAGYQGGIMNGIISTAILNGYGDPRGSSVQRKSDGRTIFKSNERFREGAKITFPIEGGTKNPYLPY